MSQHDEHHFVSAYDDGSRIDATDRQTNITAQTLDEMRQIVARYPEPRSALLPMLHLVQSVDGRISDAGVNACAEILGISTAQVNGVATFYTMYKRRPAGEHHIGVCTTSLCAVMGGDVLLAQMKDKLGIDEDETTPDGKFSLEACRCVGACGLAPVVLVNDDVYGRLTGDDAELDEILNKYKA